MLRKKMTFLRNALHGVTGSEKSMKRPPSELLWTYLMLLSVLSTSKVGLKWCTLHFRSSSNYYCSEFSCCPLNYRPIATILLQVYIVLIFPWLCCEKRDAVALLNKLLKRSLHKWKCYVIGGIKMVLSSEFFILTAKKVQVFPEMSNESWIIEGFRERPDCQKLIVWKCFVASSSSYNSWLHNNLIIDIAKE